MKLRNKKTGEIVDFAKGNFISSKDYGFVMYKDGGRGIEYNSLAEFNEQWEDYEEPKNNRTWFLDFDDVPDFISYGDNPITDHCYDDWNELGICFETKEEAEKAVEKLKAWKRLRDKGFRFEGINQDYTRFFGNREPFRTGKKYLQFNKSEDEDWLKENWDDLQLLFGGEE